MTNALLNLVEKYRQDHALLESCQLAVQQVYPELLLRWSRIYGRRWAYLSGNSAETICLNPTRIKVSPEYGICIDNVEVLSPFELENMIKTLEGCLADAGTQSK